MSNFDQLWSKVSANPHDFTTWTALLESADKQDDSSKFREVFDQFLELFPFCYGYWKKYAELEKHKNGKDHALKIYERGIKAVPLSVELWIAYTDAYAETHQSSSDFEDKMRALYEQAVDMVGLEFHSDSLWENYISWETSYNRYILARRLYERLLAVPTQLYFQNWDSFKRLIEDNSLKDLMSTEEIAPFHAKVDAKAAKAIEDGLYLGVLLPGDDEPKVEPSKPRCYFISFEEEETIKQWIVNSREKIYQAAYQQIMKRWFFEEKIRRPYFHVKPLDETQLLNWADYLSFEIAELERLNQINESQKEQLCGSHAGSRRVRVLFERCVIACAMYEHMWIRYAKYLEDEERDYEGAFRIYYRACNIHLRNKPTVHLHWALFMDRHTDLNWEKVIPTSEDSIQGWPLMPTQKNLGFENNQKILPSRSLDVFTALEKRLPNSALVCSRRCDSLRKSGASLTDLMLCLRSGINRLRYTATEHYEKAYEVRGTSASLTAQRYLVLSQQAKAGSAFLACKMARMLHHLVSAEDKIPKWKLLLSTCYNPKNTTKAGRKRKHSSSSDAGPAKEQKLDVDTDNSNEDEFPSSPPEIVCVTKKMPNGHQQAMEEEQPDEEVTEEVECPIELELTVLNLPDVRTLTEEDRKTFSGFQAAVEVLKEALEYDSHNERLLVQWLDLIYQIRPVDLDAFCEVCDMAVGSSTLPEESKLAFMQRKLQMLEEFGMDSSAVSTAYDAYLTLVTSMHNFRTKKTGQDPAAGDNSVQQQMYQTHMYQDLLNVTPASILTQSKQPLVPQSQTPIPSYGIIPKANPSTTVNMMMAGSESFQGSMATENVQAQYSAGAYDPMARAQGDSSGMPPPTPVAPLMHPPMGNTSTNTVQNEAWRKAAAAVGQHMAPLIVEHS